MTLANAAHVKNVPGRKTDVNDNVWLADLMAHGLIRASFVPGEPTQQMRDLLRTRKQFVRERSSHIQRMHKTLEDANLKLDSVVSDILGLSARRMIEALNHRARLSLPCGDNPNPILDAGRVAAFQNSARSSEP